MKPLIRHVAQAARQSRGEFLVEHDVHVLVIEPFASLEDTGFQTLAGSELRTGTPMVAALVKRPGANAFASMVTLGRAQNNDVELKYPSVSKFHAYVVQQDVGWVLTDGGSTYGTFVGGRRLEPRVERHALASGDGIRLGNLRATYYTPEGFHAFLLQELERGAEPDRAGSPR